MSENQLLERITVDPRIFGGKPIIRGHRLAVEHVLSMLAAGDTFENLLAGYPWLEREDLRQDRFRRRHQGRPDRRHHAHEVLRAVDFRR